MRLLLDTNILLEILLDQERADEAQDLLALTPADQLHLSDFSVYSIGLILFRRNKHQTFVDAFLGEMLPSGIGVVSLRVPELHRLSGLADEFGLDFDDAYQYAVAEAFALQVVSFDNDFDRTKRGRVTPRQLLRAF